MGSVVLMQPWHLMSVALHLRAEDRADFDAAGLDLQRWACERALAAGVALTVIDELGPAACFGVVDENGLGRAWLVSTDRVHAHRKRMVRAFHLLIAGTGCAFRSIEACCRADRPGAQRLLKFLGFDYAGLRPRYFANGEAAMFFSKETPWKR